MANQSEKRQAGTEVEGLIVSWLDDPSNRLSIEAGGYGNVASLAKILMRHHAGVGPRALSNLGDCAVGGVAGNVQPFDKDPD